MKYHFFSSVLLPIILLLSSKVTATPVQIASDPSGSMLVLDLDKEYAEKIKKFDYEFTNFDEQNLALLFIFNVLEPDRIKLTLKQQEALLSRLKNLYDPAPEQILKIVSPLLNQPDYASAAWRSVFPVFKDESNSNYVPILMQSAWHLNREEINKLIVEGFDNLKYFHKKHYAEYLWMMRN